MLIVCKEAKSSVYLKKIDECICLGWKKKIKWPSKSLTVLMMNMFDNEIQIKALTCGYERPSKYKIWD